MRRRPALALALGLLAAGLVVSRPLAFELSDALPVGARAPVDVAAFARTPGDALQLYYQLWLFRDGLIGRAPFVRDPYQFRTDGPRWNLPQTFPPLSVPFVLLSPVGGHAAYNLLVLLSFPLAGLGAFGLVRRYTGHTEGALVAALGFALVPARLGPLFGGQPAGFAAAFVPFVFWGLDRALSEGRLAGGLGGGAALLALAMLEPHYAYLVGGLILAYVPLRRLTARRPPPGQAFALLAFGALAAAGAGWLWMLRQAFLVGSIADAGRSLEEVRLFSPGPAALRFPGIYGGIALAGLAIWGLLAPGHRRGGWLRVFYGTVLAAGLVLSLGPTLPIVPLYKALHRWAPLFGMIRNPEKFRLLTSLGAAVLAGYGMAAVSARLSTRRARATGLLLAGVILVETPPWHGVAMARFPDNAAYTTLGTEAGKVLYLPIWPGDSAWSSTYLYTVTRTRVPMVNGYSPFVPRRYVSDVFGPLERLNVGDLGTAEHALLRRLGITHLVVDRAVFPPQVSPFPSAFMLARLRASPALTLEQVADPLWVFRVVDQAGGGSPALTSPVGVFYEAEALPRHSGVIVDEARASGGQMVVGRPGTAAPGFLTFGPYRLLPAGGYRATFRTRGAGLRLEVTTDLGRRVLARTAAPPSVDWIDVPLPFELAAAAPIEMRTYWEGRGEAAVDWVLVVFADRPDPEWGFEVEALPHKLVGERPDPMASGGWAGYADAVETLRTDVVTGPSRLYPAGRYQLALRARAESAVPGPLLRLSVTEPAGRVLAARLVDGGELGSVSYREVGLDFALGRPTVLEFPIGYLGGTGVLFDRIEVRAIRPP